MTFSTYKGAARNGVARLNTNGTLDGTFVPNVPVAIRPNKLVVQPDGKILASIDQAFNNSYDVIRFKGTSVQQIPIQNRTSDFDGDGRADASVFRNGTWFINPSSAPSLAPQSFYSVQFGLSTDKLTPADFDGDGKTDIAVWREGAFGYFYVLQSATNTFRPIQFGTTGDNPTLVGDWDGDGKADAAVYRNGASRRTELVSTIAHHRRRSVDFVTVQWGTGGDKPVRGDFDGDGKSDAAVFRPSDGVWYIRQSSNSQARYDYWGTATDKFVPNDYDGDGKTDLAVFRSGIWYIKQSSNGSPLYKSWGANTDLLVPADYDGDGKTDVAVYRNGVYYILNAANAPTYVNFGAVGDAPVASAFVQ